MPFYDFESQSVVQIPRQELSANAIQVHVQGIDGIVWVLADDLQLGPIKHEPFGDEMRDQIRHIQLTFAEQHDLTFDEWEEGFRRDTHPDREVALWCHAAQIYVQFTTDEASFDRRADIFHCIVTCMNTSPDGVWDVLRPRVITRAEAKHVVDRFFGLDA